MTRIASFAAVSMSRFLLVMALSFASGTVAKPIYDRTLGALIGWIGSKRGSDEETPEPKPSGDEQ